MPWAENVYQTKSEGRTIPRQCRVCRFEHTVRQFIENSFDEGISASKITREYLQKEPYNMKISHGTIGKHCKDHLFLRHIEEARLAELGIDVKAQQVMDDFTQRNSILWTGPYAVPPDLLEEMFDPIKRLQELFFLQYSRFIKMLNREHYDHIFLRESQQLGAELRNILVELSKLVEIASDSPEIKETAVLMIAIKAFDSVGLAAREELIQVLKNKDILENLCDLK